MSQQTFCPICGIFLKEPYIHCIECQNPSRSFCLQCFAKGREYGNHKNNHSYVVHRNNFTLFDHDWMASEEIKLLDAISECGIGSWSDVARLVGSKSKAECEEHYLKCYIYNPKSPLPAFPEQEIISDVYPTPLTCTTFSQDPPRPIVGSVLHMEMAGYMPARGDFSTEHDDYAEHDVTDLDFRTKDDPLWIDLQKAVLGIYQSRLKERARRKWIVKTYGLISIKRNLEDYARYTILGNTVQESMKSFMRLMTPDKYNEFMEGALWEEKTKQQIKMLQDCRAAGITRLHSISTFMRLRRRREERQKSRTALDDVLTQLKDEQSCQQFIRKQVLKEGIQGVPDANTAGRRTAPPINIIGMPGYEKLTAKERELCATLRLLPSSFLQYKTTLINEFRKLGVLRLANARSVIKIDVNKTRKIYDLLVEEGLVNKGS